MELTKIFVVPSLHPQFYHTWLDALKIFLYNFFPPIIRKENIYIMNVFDNKCSWNISHWYLVNIEYLVSHFQAIAISWAPIQFNLSISTFHQNYDIALQLNDLEDTEERSI